MANRIPLPPPSSFPNVNGGQVHVTYMYRFGNPDCIEIRDDTTHLRTWLQADMAAAFARHIISVTTQTGRDDEWVLSAMPDPDAFDYE